MKQRLILGVMLLFAAVFISSCGKAPQKAVDAAFAALDSAKAAGADVYLADEFVALQDSLLAVTERMETEKAKTFGNFGTIKAKLAEITTAAESALAKVEIRKEEIKKEIAAAQVEISTLQAENNKLIGQAPKGKESAAALTTIKNDIALIDASVAEAGTLMADGDLKGASDKINAAKESASSINTELKEVIAKYTRKK